MSVKVWTSAQGAWRIFLACVVNMGNLHSVPSWCRQSGVKHICHENAALGPTPYIDDSTLISRADDIEACAECSDELS